MLSKTFAFRAFPANPGGEKYPKSVARRALTQRGVTLIELMVGIAIGLLTVAVAMGALMVSRSVSGTVSDASGIQQQASNAMRVIGLQLRQAGSLYLNLNSTNAASVNAPTAPVAFETTAAASGTGNSFDPATHTLLGGNSPITLTVGYRRYKEAVYSAAAEQSLVRNCLGGPADTNNDQRVESIFQLNDSELRCNGNGAGYQPIVQNVANFQVRYLLQDNTTPGDTKIQYVTADSVDNWGKVQAVEVCLVLYGVEPIDMPAGSTYTDCDGATNVDMAALTGVRARRMHIAFRNVYQLRSQGLIGTVL
ncbi:prepilin-type N-terminal cleavage/methylation domain-containing protein [Acidovorax sp. SRB_14]|uniref:PilW family protein n=1 Tax=Acidovorax sp. SRB_14 TaxID=1962699 RepID=UPI0015661D19|nr:PilW family protein [Acidovorax sp. SRB_14]NMM82095.1 prepilin-type N-terminal cleavage/methylation domain-containing protein [Acidovorax sp. SRB_14]